MEFYHCHGRGRLLVDHASQVKHSWFIGWLLIAVFESRKFHTILLGLKIGGKYEFVTGKF
jgi:hypothetical protein